VNHVGPGILEEFGDIAAVSLDRESLVELPGHQELPVAGSSWWPAWRVELAASRIAYEQSMAD
jgi:hypothetical protein